MPRRDIFHTIPPLEDLLPLVDDDEQKEQIQRERELYYALQEMGDKTHTEAGALLGIPYSVARDWRAGHRPHHISYLVEPRGKRNKFTPSRRSSVALASILGICLGNMSHHHSVQNPLKGFTYEGSNEALRGEIASSLSKIVGDDAFAVHQRGKRKVLSFFSQDFFTYFCTITQGYTALPWEHLGTKNELAAFLRGFFSSTLHKDAYTQQGKWKSESLRIRTAKSKQSALLLEDIAGALYHANIYCNVETKGSERYCALKITDPDDVRVLLDMNALPQQDVEAFAALAEKPGHHKDLDAYLSLRRARQRVKEGKFANTGKEMRRISAETGIELWKLQKWAYGEFTPPIVRRYTKLQELDAQKPLREVIPFLYREYNFTAEQARNIARRFVSARCFYETLAFLEDKRVPQEEMYHFLRDGSLAPDRFKPAEKCPESYWYFHRKLGLTIEEALQATQKHTQVSPAFLYFCLERGGVPPEELGKRLTASTEKLFQELDEQNPLVVRQNGS
ncbi:MAG: hypothetical protein AABX37_00185, partial [Nanoarchaeota archaeon]